MISLQNQIEESQAFFRQSFDDERLRSEHLEEQLNDMMELHQHEVTNIKQVVGHFRDVIPVFISTFEDLPFFHFFSIFLLPVICF